MRGDANAMGNARRLFEAQSKDAYQRNGKPCRCERHQQIVRVPTKKLGVKNVKLGNHGVVHLSDCQHSDMKRTCWEEHRKPSGRIRATVVIKEEG